MRPGAAAEAARVRLGATLRKGGWHRSGKSWQRVRSGPGYHYISVRARVALDSLELTIVAAGFGDTPVPPIAGWNAAAADLAARFALSTHRGWRPRSAHAASAGVMLSIPEHRLKERPHLPIEVIGRIDESFMRAFDFEAPPPKPKRPIDVEKQLARLGRGLEKLAAR